MFCCRFRKMHSNAIAIIIIIAMIIIIMDSMFNVFNVFSSSFVKLWAWTSDIIGHHHSYFKQHNINFQKFVTLFGDYRHRNSNGIIRGNTSTKTKNMFVLKSNVGIDQMPSNVQNDRIKWYMNIPKDVNVEQKFEENNVMNFDKRQ